MHSPLCQLSVPMPPKPSVEALRDAVIAAARAFKERWETARLDDMRTSALLLDMCKKIDELDNEEKRT